MRTLRDFRQSLSQALSNHELRHRPSRFGVALFDSIAFVASEHWDRIVPGDNVFLSRQYLQALENASSRAMEMRYGLLFEGADPVAAVALQIHEFSGEALGNRRPTEDPETLGRRVGKVLRRAADAVSVRVLICGNAFVTGEHGLAIAPGVDPVQIFDGVAEVIYRIRRADKLHGQIAGVLVKDFYGPGTEAAQRLQSYGYRKFVVDPQMTLAIREDWNSFDDYVAAMGKKYRARVRSVRKKGRDVRREPLAGDSLRVHHDRIRQLFLAVHEKASFRIAELPGDYFACLSAALGDDFTMHGYFLGDRLIGFTSCIRWGERFEGHYLGLDYEYNVPHAVYQNILYDNVAEAIAAGCRVLNLGRTALEIKSGIGAEPREVTCFIRHRNPASNTVVKPLFGFVKPTNWTPRNPFGSRPDDDSQ